MTLVAVTGATGYVGRHAAHRLLDDGFGVVNLTGHPDRPSPDTARMRTERLDFSDPPRLAEALAGVDVLLNTYWVRFEHGETTFERAVRNTERLLGAARTAGVRRVVQVSVTGASPTSPLAYFRGKAAVEDLVRSSGLSWTIVRPTMVYGGDDILLNNIAWTLRHLPAFAIPGDGRYPVQPVHVEDLAGRLASLVGSDERGTHDAAGPERYTFEELVRLLRWATGSHAVLVRVPPSLAVLGARMVGALVRDVLLTADEVRGLMDGLLVSDEPPIGITSLAHHLAHHRAHLGRRYASELARHYRAA